MLPTSMHAGRTYLTSTQVNVCFAVNENIDNRYRDMCRIVTVGSVIFVPWRKSRRCFFP